MATYRRRGLISVHSFRRIEFVTVVTGSREAQVILSQCVLGLSVSSPLSLPLSVSLSLTSCLWISCGVLSYCFSTVPANDSQGLRSYKQASNCMLCKNKLPCLESCKTVNPAPTEAPPPRPHLLSFPKSSAHWGTKCSNLWAYGSHSLPNHQVASNILFFYLIGHMIVFLLIFPAWKIMCIFLMPSLISLAH